MWEEMVVRCTYFKALCQPPRRFFQGLNSLNSFEERTLKVIKIMLRNPLLDTSSNRKYKEPINLF